MSHPNGTYERLVFKESTNASDSGLVEDIEKVPLHFRIGTTLKRSLLYYCRTEKKSQAIDVAIADWTKALFLHIESNLLVPFFKVPVVSTSAYRGCFEVLDAISPKISEDLLIWSVKPEARTSGFKRKRSLVLANRSQ